MDIPFEDVRSRSCLFKCTVDRQAISKTRIAPGLYITHTTVLFVAKYESLNYYNHGSAKVKTYINHRKIKINKKLSILDSTSMPSSSSLVKEILCNREQPGCT
jgi:hypothetical protein